MSGAIEDTPGLIASPAADPDGLAALDRARSHLLSLQQTAGWWKGELETNVTMDAEDMLLREFLGIREAGKSARSAVWIRSQQREDGTWSNFAGGPGDLSTTIESYVALKLAGDDPAQPHMRGAAEWVRANGGLEQARVFTHIWMALFGAWDWDKVPSLLPEMILLPPWFPLNVYDFACWARQTVVALSVVLAFRPVRQLPFSIDELHGSKPWQPPKAKTMVAHAVVALDQVLQAYQRHPIKPLRRFCLRKVDRWIADRQESDGGVHPGVRTSQGGLDAAATLFLFTTTALAFSTWACVGTEGDVGPATAAPPIGRVTAKVVAAAMAMRATGRTGKVLFVGGLAPLPRGTRQNDVRAHTSLMKHFSHNYTAVIRVSP